MNTDELEAIFKNIKYPDKGFLTETQPSEWEYIYARLRGKQWRDLSVEDIDAQGGVIEGINCLSPEVFVYFLPGLIKLVLDDASARYCIIHGMISHFTGPEDQSAVSAQRQQSVLDLLSPEQRQFIAVFLADSVKLEPTFCLPIANSAIQSLEQGIVKTYTHVDVLKGIPAKYRHIFKVK